MSRLPDLAVVNFDGLIRTTDFVRAALQELQRGFPAEHAPASNRIVVTEARFVFDLVGWVVAQDVVHNKNNFYESDITQVEPRSVSDGRRSTAPDHSNSFVIATQILE